MDLGEQILHNFVNTWNFDKFWSVAEIDGKNLAFLQSPEIIDREIQIINNDNQGTIHVEIVASLSVCQGLFQSFDQRGARWRAKRAEIFWLPPAGGYRSVPTIVINKHINGGLTYDLLIVSLPFFTTILHIHFNFHLKEHLLNRLSLICLCMT